MYSWIILQFYDNFKYKLFFKEMMHAYYFPSQRKPIGNPMNTTMSLIDATFTPFIQQFTPLIIPFTTFVASIMSLRTFGRCILFPLNPKYNEQYN